MLCAPACGHARQLARLSFCYAQFYVPALVFKLLSVSLTQGATTFWARGWGLCQAGFCVVCLIDDLPASEAFAYHVKLKSARRLLCFAWHLVTHVCLAVYLSRGSMPTATRKHEDAETCTLTLLVNCNRGVQQQVCS
jgi:hypothetical protein